MKHILSNIFTLNDNDNRFTLRVRHMSIGFWRELSHRFTKLSYLGDENGYCIGDANGWDIEVMKTPKAFAAKYVCEVSSVASGGVSWMVCGGVFQLI